MYETENMLQYLSYSQINVIRGTFDSMDQRSDIYILNGSYKAILLDCPMPALHVYKQNKTFMKSLLCILCLGQMCISDIWSIKVVEFINMTSY